MSPRWRSGFRVRDSRYWGQRAYGVMSVVSVRAAVAGGETASDSFYLTILDAEGWVWEQSWFLGRQAGTSREEAG